jgi:hypothetical protein
MKISTIVTTLGVLLSAPSYAQSPSTATVWQGTVAGASVSLKKEWTTDPTDAQLFTVEIVPPNKQRAVLGLNDVVGGDATVRVWNDQRLAVSVNHQLSIVDVPTLTLVDQLLVSRPVFSNDNRYLAFERVSPRPITPEGVYLLYDVSASAATNRMQTTLEGPPGFPDSGIAFYPDWNRINTAYFDRTSQENERYHEAHSSFTWIAPRVFVVIDYEYEEGFPDDGTVSALLVNIENGIASPQITRVVIDATNLVDTTHYDSPQPTPASRVFAQQIAPLEVSSSVTRIRVTLRPVQGVRVTTFDVTF